ncbi:hypothetical protein [Thermithiobacillus plumbiphilus]|uniref:Uncharacterized protein n=1 Tax=Thermithiobacillus plumbiphilus TaxID=1729899 RepID=A0ABU9D6S7_9PROT
MSVIEGIFHNPETGLDERRPIACDAFGRLLAADGAGAVAASRVEVFTIGALARAASVTTDPVDLGVGHPYTLVVARKAGAASRNEAMEIQSSIDGVRWLPAAGIHPDANVAWYEPNGGSDYFTVQGRPIGRFARIAFKNGNTAQTELVLELAALAGV